MQTRFQSFVESCTNVAIGYGVAVLSQLVLFPLFGYKVSFKDSLLMGVWFTGISIVRSYCVRRMFNKLHTPQEEDGPGLGYYEDKNW